MVLGKSLQIDLGDFFIFAVKFVQLDNRVGLTLRVRGIVAEFIGFTMLLKAHLVTLFTQAEVEVFSAVHA